MHPLVRHLRVRRVNLVANFPLIVAREPAVPHVAHHADNFHRIGIQRWQVNLFSHGGVDAAESVLRQHFIHHRHPRMVDAIVVSEKSSATQRNAITFK